MFLNCRSKTKDIFRTKGYLIYFKSKVKVRNITTYTLETSQKKHLLALLIVLGYSVDYIKLSFL